MYKPKEFRGGLGRNIRLTATEALAEANSSGKNTVIILRKHAPVTVKPGDDLEEVIEAAIKSQRP